MQLTNKALIHLENLIDRRAQVDASIADRDDLQERDLRALQDDLIQVVDGAHLQVVDLTHDQAGRAIPRLLPLALRQPVLGLLGVMRAHNLNDLRVESLLDERGILGEILLGEVANVVDSHLAHVAVLREVVEDEREVDVGVVVNAPDERVQQHQVLLDLLAVLQKVLVISGAPEALEAEIIPRRHEIVGQRL